MNVYALIVVVSVDGLWNEQIAMNLDFAISVEHALDQFHAHSPHVGHHRNHHVQFRNCINAWLYEENLNLFPAISGSDLLAIGDEHHGDMSKNKICLLCSTCVCDNLSIGIFCMNLILFEK